MGRYFIQGLLGSGSTGTVLEAFDSVLGRRVALKVLHGGLGENHGRRLIREAQAMAMLSHPNVVQVYEVARIEGKIIVVMELVAGMTLRKWMRQPSRPGWRECVDVFLGLGTGLAAAHACGLIHRDFKPSNAIVDSHGRSRVLDFGLARCDPVGDGPESQATTAPRSETHEDWSVEFTLTRTGSVLGTPAYMAPEQMRGHEVSAASDQFSFCVSLYEALYGQRPFEGSSMAALMVSVIGEEVRPVPRGSRVPNSLRKVLLRGLACRPEERWPSVDALLLALRECTAVTRRRLKVSMLTTAALMTGVGLGMGMGLYLGGHADADAGPPSGLDSPDHASMTHAEDLERP